jgi:uncharacterized protein (DUF1786 family)
MSLPKDRHSGQNNYPGGSRSQMSKQESKILAVDIGGGTQDILLYEEGIPVENCVKLVLPAQTQIIAGRLARATRHQQPVFLCGRLMGGGALVGALRQHLAAGLQAYATPQAARTVRDNLDEVAAMGVQIALQPPEGHFYGIYLQDLDLDSLRQALELFDVTLPDTIAVALQDHGECIGKSNRKFRFEHWERFLARGGTLRDLIYGGPGTPDVGPVRDVPAYLTRMLSLREAVPGAFVMDTGAAAIRGALLDPAVEAHRPQGLMIVNAGNQHTLAALIRGDSILGIFEHHTGLLTPDRLRDYLQRFARGQVTNEEVYDDQGHGCAYSQEAAAAGNGSPWSFVAVTGPQRRLAEGLGYFAAPHGDMMLSGCFGLVTAVRELAAG